MTSVSIIVPTYKRIDQTVKTLKLIFASRGWGMEFTAEVVVADSTPDKSLEKVLLENFGTEVIYTKPERAGIATNKNQGAKMAKYPILVFCDSDMEVEPDTLINTINSLQKHPTTGAIGGQVIWKGGGKDGELDRPRPEDRIKTLDGVSYIEALYSRFLVTYKSVFWEVGGYDERVFNMRGEGSDLSIRYWRAGFPLVYDVALKVHHVYEAADSIALRVTHPEWGVAKDLLLLGYKYDMFGGDYPNFRNTVYTNFKHLGSEAQYRIIEGIGKNFDVIHEAKPYLDEFRVQDTPSYEFKFLEIISNSILLLNCISAAKERILKLNQATS